MQPIRWLAVGVAGAVAAGLIVWFSTYNPISAFAGAAVIGALVARVFYVMWRDDHE